MSQLFASVVKNVVSKNAEVSIIYRELTCDIVSLNSIVCVHNMAAMS